VSGFKEYYRSFPDHAPLHRHVEQDDVGNAAVFLASELSRNTTGEVLFVDAGANVVAGV
jgi:enoyl-[acyl-carrier protein] reductase I